MAGADAIHLFDAIPFQPLRSLHWKAVFTHEAQFQSLFSLIGIFTNHIRHFHVKYNSEPIFGQKTN
jgi:hypothetical protein